MNFPPPSERQARLIWFALTGLAIAALVALLVALIWSVGQVLRMLSPVLWPLAIAGVLAYLLDPVVDKLEARGLTRPRAIIAVFAFALLVVIGLFASVVPQVVVETRQLASRLPAYAAKAELKAETILTNPPPLVRKLLWKENLPASPPVVITNEVGALVTNTPARMEGTNQPAASPQIDGEKLQDATKWLAQTLPKIGVWLFGQVGRVAAWFGVLAGLFLIPVYAFYFLLEKQGIKSQWTEYLPVRNSRFKDELVFVLNSINDYLIAFFRGQVLVAICDGTLYGLGFVIIGLPYAVLIGVMAVCLTMIPFLGAIVTCIAALTIALVQFGDWTHPLLVLVVFGIVQALEGTVISPKIMGNRVGLHPVTIIISVMVGTTLLGGLLGGILAIPFTAALRVLMFRYIWKRSTQAKGAALGSGSPV